MQIQTTFPLVEEILSPWETRMADDYTGYHNHVYRMLNCCLALYPQYSDEDMQKLQIAASFHDLGVWSDDTVDYLPPSVAMAREYLDANDKASWVEEISLMIDLHHKVRSVQEPRYPLVEIFRQGDLIDFSLGMVRFGLPASLIRDIKTTFPNAGFHKTLTRLGLRWFSSHPLSLPPFLKW